MHIHMQARCFERSATLLVYYLYRKIIEHIKIQSKKNRYNFVHEHTLVSCPVQRVNPLPHYLPLKWYIIPEQTPAPKINIIKLWNRHQQKGFCFGSIQKDNKVQTINFKTISFQNEETRQKNTSNASGKYFMVALSEHPSTKGDTNLFFFVLWAAFMLLSRA